VAEDEESKVIRAIVSVIVGIAAALACYFAIFFTISILRGIPPDSPGSEVLLSGIAGSIFLGGTITAFLAERFRGLAIFLYGGATWLAVAVPQLRGGPLWTLALVTAIFAAVVMLAGLLGHLIRSRLYPSQGMP
jgi:hypothetical protein